MTRPASIAFVLLITASSLHAQDAAVKELEGEYTLKAFERGGKPVPDEAKKAVSPVVIVAGKLKFTAGGKELVANLKADKSKKPAEIDLYPQGTDYEKGRKFQGVYQLEKGELTLVFVEDGDRPKDLKGDAVNATKLVLVKK